MNYQGVTKLNKIGSNPQRDNIKYKLIEIYLNLDKIFVLGLSFLFHFDGVLGLWVYVEVLKKY